MVELLLTEFAQEYPEVMRPLLHDRCAAYESNVACCIAVLCEAVAQQLVCSSRA